MLTRDNVRQYLERPWASLETMKLEYWRDALARDPLATFRASVTLSEQLRLLGRVPTDADRDADLAAHVRLRELLSRAHGLRHT